MSKKITQFVLLIIASYLVVVMSKIYYNHYQFNNRGRIDHKYEIAEFNKYYSKLLTKCPDNTPAHLMFPVSHQPGKELGEIDRSVLDSFSALQSPQDKDLLINKILKLQNQTGIKLYSSLDQISDDTTMRTITKRDKIEYKWFEDAIINSYGIIIGFDLENMISRVVVGVNSSDTLAYARKTESPLLFRSYNDIMINLSQTQSDVVSYLLHEIVGHLSMSDWSTIARTCNVIDYFNKQGMSESEIKLTLFDLLTYDQSIITSDDFEAADNALTENSIAFKSLYNIGLNPYSFYYLYKHRLNGEGIRNFNLDAIGNNVEFEATLIESLGRKVDEVALTQSLKILTLKTGNKNYQNPEFRIKLLEFIDSNDNTKKLIIAEEMKNLIKNP